MLEVILPAMIVNALVDTGWAKIAILVGIYAIMVPLLTGVDRGTNLIREAYGYQSINLRMNKINKKAMSLDYPDTENVEVLDMMEAAKESVWEFNDVGYVICTDLLGNMLSLATMSAIFIMLNPWVCLVTLTMTCASAYIERKKLKVAHDSHILESKAKRRSNYCKELLQNQKLGKEVRAYHADEFLIQKYRRVQSEYLCQIESREKKLWRWSFLQRSIYFFQLIITYIVAIAGYRSGNIAIGWFLMYVSASKEMFFVVQEIFDNLVELSDVADYYKDYSDYMDIEENMLHPDYQTSTPQAGQGVLEFRNVSFTYSSQTQPAIVNVNFKIEPGEKVALVGDNGAGKSTIIKLILRLHDPTEGAIYFNNKDIKSYDYIEYLKLFSCAFQDYQLFSYTLKENICFDDADNTEKLHRVIEQTMLDHVVEKCSQGVDTYLGREFSEHAVELSGGERQSVALARAFYKDSPIILFDEPTAALDPIREREIYRRVERFCQAKTAIFVSHRMGSTSFCNKILVFDEGKLVEKGDHSLLMKAKGLYYDMYEKQSCYYR
ncbi:MAG: ABC transporter ATP-binding protein [Clostridia bacterium]|nr:ABC transporter ATP-binding protein [Clostridia bacterium]